jgi:hypothetical protein
MTNTAAKIDTVKDIDQIMSGVILATPREIPISAELMASQVMSILNRQYGDDSSAVRVLLARRKLEDMARGHLRRNFDPEVTAEQEQLAFTEFGDDIQSRYPIKTSCDEGGLKTEYVSPMYAPVDQLTEIAEREITVGNTRIRRGNALLAFIAEYR